jgi:hypothetical protein
MPVPNLFIIGAQRAATTSLHLTLNAHPDIFMSQIKEPQYFTSELLKQSGDSDSYHNYIRKGQYRIYNRYISLFTGVTNEKIIGESSHYMYRFGNAKIIRDFNSRAQIIICIRNPFERLFSEYSLLLNNDKITLSYDEFVLFELNRYKSGQRSKLHKGLYVDSINEYRNEFSDVYLLDFEELIKNSRRELSKIFNFLRVDDRSNEIAFLDVKSVIPNNLKRIIHISKRNFFSNELLKLARKFLNRSQRKLIVENISMRVKHESSQFPETIYYGELVDFYQNDIQNLSEILGKDLNHWFDKSRFNKKND